MRLFFGKFSNNNPKQIDKKLYSASEEGNGYSCCNVALIYPKLLIGENSGLFIQKYKVEKNEQVIQVELEREPSKLGSDLVNILGLGT